MLADEAIFNITSEGIKFKTMDISHNAVCNFNWKKESFVQFECSKDNMVGFRTDDMLKIMKRFDMESDLEITMSDEVNALNIKSADKDYQMRILDIYEASKFNEIPEQLKATMPAVFETTVDKISTAIEDIIFLGDFITFEVKNGICTVSLKGDSANGKIKIAEGITAEAISNFNLDFMKKFLSSLSASADKVTVHLGTNVPIEMNFHLSENEVINYFLAPLVAN